MRTLSATLESAQQSSSINALYKVELTGANSYTYAQDRILSSEHDESPYSHRATIVLDNKDGELDDKDLKGYQAVISYGAVTSAGNEYSSAAPLYVVDQYFNSWPGRLTCKLDLEGIPNIMMQDEASESYVPDDTDTSTVKSLVEAIAGATLSCFSHCYAYNVVWDSGYDSLADSYKPRDSFRVYTGGARLAALRRVLDFTANVARFSADGKIHVLKPVTSGASYDYEYSLESGHTFFSKAYVNSMVFPNRVVVQSRSSDDPQYSGSAQVDDYASLPAAVRKTKYVQVRLESNTQATEIAEVLIAKAEMQAQRGAAEVPLNAGAEVFDYVKVTDSRQGDARTGNLGYVHRRFGEGKWTATFGFSSWPEALRYSKILKELETYTDAGNYFARLHVDNLYAKNILAENCDFVWLDPDNTIDLSQIGDTLDNLPDGEQYARVKSLHLDAGQVKLDENVLYQVGYNPTTKFDLDDDTLDDIPEGTIYQRVKSAALTADGLVILDNTQVGGVYGLVKSTDISAGHIKLDTVTPGTYGLVKSTDISSGHIKLDTVATGTYGLVKSTDIYSGHIRLSSTVKDGEWYNENGVEIDAAHGINIYGEDSAFTTRASKYGTIQCKVDSGGRIVAGGGNVTLSEDGITIEGQDIIFQNGSAKGYVFMNWTNGITISSAYGINLASITGSHGIRSAGHELYSCGYTDHAWSQVVGKYLFASDGAVHSYQHHDDLALLKAIKAKPNKEGRDSLDASSLPEELVVTNEQGERYVNLGGLQGLNLGIAKALLARIEALEERL